MLSPCIRQVTHALLTRPPLSHKSPGFIMAPFDLHVLSTPPAFILSQDQTLMFILWHLLKCLSTFRCPARILWLILILLLGLFCSLKFSCSPGRFGLFGWHYSLILPWLPRLLWNLQGCITVYLSRCGAEPRIQPGGKHVNMFPCCRF